MVATLTTCYICLCVAGEWTTPCVILREKSLYYTLKLLQQEFAKGTAGAGCLCSRTLRAQQEYSSTFRDLLAEIPRTFAVLFWQGWYLNWGYCDES